MNETNLTDRQYRILEYLYETIKEEGYPPTLREIGKDFGISSTKGVSDHLDALERKGWIRKEEGRARGIRLVEEKVGELFAEKDRIPIVGKVTAGEPDLAVENVEGKIDFREMFPRREGLFALRVRGESMSGAGIRKGDVLVVRKQSTARVGDIVVAVVDGDEGTVKRLSRKGEKIHLEPENDDYEKIVKPSSQVEIRGVVTGVVRKM